MLGTAAKKEDQLEISGSNQNIFVPKIQFCDKSTHGFVNDFFLYCIEINFLIVNE